MEMMTLKMRGTASDNTEIYRSYCLVTDGGRMTGRGRASVIPMSVGAPMPDNQGLISVLNDNPS
jgi:hypothetical protein